MFFTPTNNFPKSYKPASKPHKFCPGCGHGIALKSLGQTIDDFKIAQKSAIGIDIGCSLLAWDFFNVDTVQTHHGRTVPTMAGYKLAAPNRIAIAYVGDGGAYAIGLQSLINSARRNDPITVIIINNTLYGMTGGQTAPTTLIGQVTTSSPAGQIISPFMGPELLRQVANKKALIQRATVAQPIQLKNYLHSAIEHQMKNNSFSMVEILSMCPINWKKGAKESLEYLENNMAKIYAIGEIK